MTEHTMKRFESEMTKLRDMILGMGGLVEDSITRCMEALLKQDMAVARKVIEADKAINALEVECDEMTRAMLVRRQPAANDLRFIIATIKIVTDLERMGDLAEGIAEATIKSQDNPLTHLSTLEALGNRVVSQVNRALDALTRSDVQLALEVVQGDKHVDDLYHGVQREVITYMLEDPREISAGILASGIAKNLERIGDHATNIAEMAIYIVKGHDIRHVDHDSAAALLKEKQTAS
ncbi:MAG TPA: phosphate signaling complex protein PhoU [Mariprofundaceae bacterium]|nr:phosphate signaling complex protein PhoU [Mariprofundaceae bacterium]